MDSNNKAYQMVRAAELYYEQGHNQSQIGRILGCSTSTVSRLLAEAHEQGLVEIIIHRPVVKLPDLSRELEKMFGLREAIVLAAGHDYDENIRNVGAAAAELLPTLLRDGDRLGISLGNTLHHTIEAVRPTSIRNIEVIQLLGGLGQSDPHIDGPELALRAAQKFNGTYRYINAPAVVETAEIRDTMLQQRSVRTVIEMAQKARVVLAGVGALVPERSSLVRSGYLTATDLEELKDCGAVGHLNAKVVNIDGEVLDHEYNDRVICAPLEFLRHADWSIGVAASTAKAEAIVGVLRGRYYNVFVTDEAAAEAVMEYMVSRGLHQPAVRGR